MSTKLKDAYEIGGFTGLPDFGERYRLRMLIMGDSGSGKSGLAATAPNTIIADVEGQTEGSLAVRRVGGHAFRIRQFRDMEDLLTQLERGKHGFQSIVVDSFTDLASKAGDVSLEEAEERSPNRLGDLMDRDIHYRVQIKMRRILHRLVSLPMHMLIITSISEVEKKIFPDVPPSVSRHVRQLMDMCGYTQIVDLDANPDEEQDVMSDDMENQSRELRVLFQPRGKIQAVKDNTGALGAVMKSPSIPRILARIAFKALAGDTLEDEAKQKLVEEIGEKYNVN